MTNFSELVEGEFNGFAIKFLKPEDKEKVFAHLEKYWYPGEIMGKMAGVDENYKNDFGKLCSEAFDEDLSFIAWDTEKNEIASLRLTVTARKTDSWEDIKITSKGIKKVLRLVKDLNEKANMYERFGIDHLANFLVASTATEYRGKGLATEMYRRSILLLKAKGFPLCKSAFSSPFTRKAVSNLGFTEIARVYMKDYKNENGEMEFKGAGDDDFCAILCLKL